MRKGVVNDIASLLSQIIQNYPSFKENQAEGIVNKALEVIKDIVDWGSLELFVGNMPYIVHFLGNDSLQTASAKCIYSIIDKGMDPKKKLDLFDSLGLIHILNQWDPFLTVTEEDFGKMVFSYFYIILDGSNN